MFEKISQWLAHMAGRSGTFVCAGLMILVWMVSGPFFGYSDTWQLVINTSTTIITFLMVFIIQNTQTRDTEALQLKIDELLRINARANNALLDIEELTDEDLMEIRKRYVELAEKARNDVNTPGSSGSNKGKVEAARGK